MAKTKVTAKKGEQGAPAWLPRQQPLTDAACKKFLYALMRDGNVSKAARYAKANRTALFQRKRRDDEFAAVWEECLQIGTANLEDHAHDLAMNGWQEPVFHDGEECGEKQRFSPALIIFLLKAHNPERYRERYEIENTGKGGGPLQLNVVLNPKALTEA